MNARLYDSDIGRFTSADTYIQAPENTQSYNRYSYVLNNPLVYTDPTGHFFKKLWKKIKKHIKTIAAIVVAAVIAIYLPGMLVKAFGTELLGGVVTHSAFGTAVVGGGTSLSALGVATVGAAAGFASGAIMTGTLSGALQGAAWGAVSGLVAFGIGEGLGHAGGIMSKGVSAGKAFIKAAAHGLSRGIISMAQGGTFKSGFASGFSGSFFSPGTSMGGDGAGGFGLRTSISAIVGGTASKLGGGKFSNGAISAAFVHRFNQENIAAKISKGLTQALNKLYDRRGEIRNVINTAVKGGYEGYKQVRDHAPAEARWLLRVAKTQADWMFSRGLSNWQPEIGQSYDFMSGFFFDTIPTTTGGAVGYLWNKVTEIP